MNKYKEQGYKVKQETGSNADDNYVICAHGDQIYRYDEYTLAILIKSKRRSEYKRKEFEAAGIYATIFVSSTNEVVWWFKETDFAKVAEIMDAKKKRTISEKERIRLAEVGKKYLYRKNNAQN